MPGGTAWDEGKNTEVVEVARVFLGPGIPVAGQGQVLQGKISSGLALTHS
jgi:hypothetical protein